MKPMKPNLGEDFDQAVRGLLAVSPPLSGKKAKAMTVVKGKKPRKQAG